MASTSADRVRRHRMRRRLAGELLFVRQDWALFLDPTRLPQKAGCSTDQLRAVALKELVDNALDHAEHVTLDQLDPNTWAVTDDGPGLTPELIATLFAVDRPLTSSKLLRRPTRGAVGNGLRVVTGAAMASGGTLHVESRGDRYRIEVDRDTGTAKAVTDPCNAPRSQGTKVTIAFGEAIGPGRDDSALAREAMRFPGRACEPFRSHLGWYDDAAWRELAEAAPAGTTVADLLALMGIASTDIRPAVQVHLAQLARLTLPAEPKLLPRGDQGTEGYVYARESGSAVLVEAWAAPAMCSASSKVRSDVKVFVNRAPIIGGAELSADGWLSVGGNYVAPIDRVKLNRYYEIELSITAPFVPIINDGKSPDLSRWCDLIGIVLAKALRAAHRAVTPAKRRGDIKEAAFEVMAEAYAKASGDGTLPANARQIMYAARPLIAELLGQDREPVNDKYFTQVLLPDFIAENEDDCKDWDVIYDARGHLTEPHTGTEIPLGTVAVRNYLVPRRNGHGGLLSVGGMWTVEPRDRYRTVLFLEKEGFAPLLRKAQLAERFDCAVMSTKGMSVVAARHLLDRLAQDDVVVLVAHDFDRAGLAIAHTLVNDGRRYEFEHTPQVVDIGLRLADVEGMEL